MLPRLRLRQAMNCVTLPQLSSAEAVSQGATAHTERGWNCWFPVHYGYDMLWFMFFKTTIHVNQVLFI